MLNKEAALTSWLCLLVAVSGIQWKPDVPPTGYVIHAVAGSDVRFPWYYELSLGEELDNMVWGFNDFRVAYFFNGTFHKTAQYIDRFRVGANGSTIRSHVRCGDSAKYSVSIVARNVSTGEQTRRLTHEITLRVEDDLLTDDGQLHVKQETDAVLDSASQLWSVVLSCGHFNFNAQHPFSVHWETPSGETVASSGYHDGDFLLRLPRPVSGGAYVCRVPQQHVSNVTPSPGCFHGNQSTEARVEVDRVDATFLLLDAELGQLRADKEKLQQDVLRVGDKLAAMQTSSTGLMQGRRSFSAQTSRVSFDVRMWTDQVVTPPAILQFPNVTSNQGGGFDNTTGHFTAPVSGTYVLNFHANSESSQNHAHSKVMAAGREVCRVFVMPTDHGTCQGVVTLTQGDLVWVEPWGEDRAYWGMMTSFMGFLISED